MENSPEKMRENNFEGNESKPTKNYSDVRAINRIWTSLGIPGSKLTQEYLPRVESLIKKGVPSEQIERVFNEFQEHAKKDTPSQASALADALDAIERQPTEEEKARYKEADREMQEHFKKEK